MTDKAIDDKKQASEVASYHGKGNGIKSVPAEFADIAPYSADEFAEHMRRLVAEPGFEHAIRYVMPDIDFEAFKEHLLAMSDVDEFQIKIVAPWLEMLAKATSAGVTIGGAENIIDGQAYTYISNHRDIVLDASFLDMLLARVHKPLAQVAIGNNLLIYDWITDLVKLNGSFIVKRDVKMLEALRAARQLSAYIHFAVAEQKKSVWIAQREGRAKDSNDTTQESLVKMLAFAGGTDDVKTNLQQINLMPVSISYEFDPNDYLKVREYLLKRRDPEFKKSQHDDLLSMETGILKNKGRIHFEIGRCINPLLASCACDKREAVHCVCNIIDREIHLGYKLFEGNYIAYDELNGTQRFADKYTSADVERFEKYVACQLGKVDVAYITPDERDYMRRMLLTMYANPVANQLAAQQGG